MLDKAAIKDFPALPGVYLMRDDAGHVLYVGKADNLRSRVANYFRPAGDNRPQIPRLMARVAAIDCQVTDTGKEALILENNLIKKYRPRYNIYFRDDKTYSSIRIDLQSPFPRPVLVRRVKNDGALYFGPYVAGRSLKSTLRFLQKIFPYRICSDNVFGCRSRPCLYYQIGRCPAPCTGKISPGEYREIIDHLVLFLKGREGELLRSLRRRLKTEAEELRYEAAARTRDRIRAIEETLEKQKINRVDPRDRDVIVLESRSGLSVFQVLSIRGGRMLDGRAFFFDRLFPDPPEALESFLAQYYGDAHPPPDEIVLPLLPASSRALGELLRERKNGPVTLTVPRRGMKLEWIRLARKNAAVALKNKLTAPDAGEVLARLEEKLRLRRRPEIIEVFDISNLGGREAVGAMAVFRGGEKSPSDYRRYRIRTKESPDDYAMLAEVLARRLGRAVRTGVYPDLIVVDGGKGQLNAALRVREELGTDYPDLAALAKAKRSPSGRVVGDRVFIPGRKNPVPLRPGSPELLLLARIRDEAHRFAVAYHRKLRREAGFSSPLERVEGIGPALRRRLLDRFGSVEKVRSAPVGELTAVRGISRRLAEKIVAGLSQPAGEG
ncbi:MAG: excinuclease ABC subunit UvrC [Candidatus Erginobacter occultus]|nr:excinuclease ABC subunit UvrC [Candidatus Erginobacter occultus]